MKKIVQIVLLLTTLSLIYWGCSNQKKEKNNTDNEFSEEFKEDESSTETFYRIPSPDEMFSFIDDKGIKFTKEYLNPTQNLDNYLEIRQKELNFGIYSADLAYCAAFHHFQGSVDYINTVKRLAEDIEISAIFDDNMNKRIQHIFDNADTLVNVTNATYYKIVNYLQKNERNKTLALLTTGGWLETMYIVTNVVDKYKENDETIQHIADQKLTYENLMLSLEQYKDDPNISQTIEDLKEIGKIYSQLKIESNNQNTKQNSENNVIVVGSNAKIVITEQQLKQLRDKVAIIRNKITGNSNS